jgi:hypothetical protein
VIRPSRQDQNILRFARSSIAGRQGVSGDCVNAASNEQLPADSSAILAESSIDPHVPRRHRDGTYDNGPSYEPKSAAEIIANTVFVIGIAAALFLACRWFWQTFLQGGK